MKQVKLTRRHKEVLVMLAQHSIAMTSPDIAAGLMGAGYITDKYALTPAGRVYVKKLRESMPPPEEQDVKQHGRG